MTDMPKRPVMSVVDYDAWERGYMPPSEHILIDQLAYRGARVRLMFDHAERGAYWIVERPGTDPDGMRQHLKEMLAIQFRDEPAPLADDSPASIPEGHSAPLDERTTAEMMHGRDQESHTDQ